MGRVQRRDTGDPGKFYFVEPTTLTVKGKATPPTSSSNAVVVSFPRSNTLTTGMCRLKSSHGLHAYTPPTDIVYDMGVWPMQVEIDAYLRKMEIAGFGEGAVVTRRFQQPFRWKYVHQWGVIIIAHENHNNPTSSYHPYTVKWFSAMNMEGAWAEDLIVIHQCISDDLIANIVEDQGIDPQSGMSL